jgi:prepilin-type N-terminal cleavage/methylation domain-containing protein
MNDRGGDNQNVSASGSLTINTADSTTTVSYFQDKEIPFMRTIRHTPPGFTLIELIICVGILVLLLGLVVCVFSGWESSLPPATTVTPPNLSELPSEFSISQEAYSFSSKLYVEANGQKWATITRDAKLGGPKSFTLTDNRGIVIATASKAVWSWGTQVDVFDERNQKLGTLKEEVFKSWLGQTTYDVLNAQGGIIATSRKSEGMTATSFTLLQPNGAPWATLEKSPRFGVDRWTARTHLVEGLDRRLIVIIAAFKTDKDKE